MATAPDLYEDDRPATASPGIVATARQIAIATKDLTAFLALGGTIEEWQELKHD